MAQTSTLSLVYRGGLDADRLSAFVDASHAPNVTSKALDNAYSITGCLLYFRGCLVDWTSKKQRIIARSSAAAEIIAITDVLDNIRTTNHFLTKLTNTLLPVTVYEDASSARTALEKGSDRNLRWILIRAEDVTAAIQNGEITIREIAGQNQLADALTKPLLRDRFLYLRNWMLEPLP